MADAGSSDGTRPGDAGRDSRRDSGWDAGDEARRLLDAVQDWARRTMPAPPDGHGGPECQWCPLCRVASVLRGEHPEFTERVAEAGAGLLTALRYLGESGGAGAATASGASGASGPFGASGAARAAQPADPTDRGPEPPRVQRINLDEPGTSA